VELSWTTSQRNEGVAPAIIAWVLTFLSLTLGHLLGLLILQGYTLTNSGYILPGLFVVTSAAFLAPLLSIKREQRYSLVWLLLPAAGFMVNALFLLLYTLTSNWQTWQNHWPILPIGIGVALYTTYLVGPRSRWLLLIATALTGYSLWILGYLSAFVDELIYTQPWVPAAFFLIGIVLVGVNLSVARQDH
jgi:hypothetical protein